MNPTVNAAPVKSFFVSMLTRDIKLEEAILDLLDNCVDGIIRRGVADSDRPYVGKWANIEFSKSSFCIEDNCGGIPWELSQYAFRMGRASGRGPDAPGAIGVYGIGMKRAIFKMGKSCLISTQSGNDRYGVDITPDWVDDETNWDIPVRTDEDPLEEDGTLIIIGNLHDGIATQFEEQKQLFQAELERLISSHYAFIIGKGFRVSVNGQVVAPRQTELIYADNGDVSGRPIQPFLYQAKTDDGVDVFLAVGFTRPIPSESEALSEQEERRRSTEEAGWTIVCNDRAVVYRDRSELTGWGEAGVPRYHTQFIAVSGIVEFKCDDPGKLPTTTTKRGVDASSVLYLQVKNKMREGMKLFTDYTNRWKGRAEETKPQFDAGITLSLDRLKARASQVEFSRTSRSIPGALQYKPTLPVPPRTDPRKRRISFSRDAEEVRLVASHLFDNSNHDPSQVGEKCFEMMLEEATD